MNPPSTRARLPNARSPTRWRCAPTPIGSSPCTTAACLPAAETSTTSPSHLPASGSSTPKTGRARSRSVPPGSESLACSSVAATAPSSSTGSSDRRPLSAPLDGSGYGEIAARGALCFTKADLPSLRTQAFRAPPASVPQGARPAAQRRRSSFFSEHRAARATPGNTSSSGTLNATRQKRVPLRQYRRASHGWLLEPRGLVLETRRCYVEVVREPRGYTVGSRSYRTALRRIYGLEGSAPT